MGPQVFQTRPCANPSSEKSSSTSQRRPYTRPGPGIAAGSPAAAASRLLQTVPGAGPSPGPSSGCRSSSVLQPAPMTTRGPRGPLPSAARVAADQPRAVAAAGGGGRNCCGSPRPPVHAWCACAAPAGPGLEGGAGAGGWEGAGVPDSGGPPPPPGAGEAGGGVKTASPGEDGEELKRREGRG